MDCVIALLVVSVMVQCCSTLFTISYSDTLWFGTMYNYVYFKQKLSWDEARWVCQSIGGDLAKIDSDEDKDNIVSLAKTYYGDGVFSVDYWVGLVNTVPGQFQWVSDCSYLTFTSNYPINWNSNELCYRVKRDYHNGQKGRCDSIEAFMCQVQTAQPCQFIQRINGVMLYAGQGIGTCEEQCLKSKACWAVVGIAPDNCIHLAIPEFGINNGPFILSSLLCANLTLNLTLTYPPVNRTSFPNATCGTFPVPKYSGNGTNSVLNSTFQLLLIQPTSSVNIQPTSSVNIKLTSSINIQPTSSINIQPTSSVTIKPPSSITIQPSAWESDSFTVRVTLSTVSTTTATSFSTTTFITTATVYVTSTATTHITDIEASVFAEEYVRNLTVNRNETSKYTRKLYSAQDNRTSSRVVGFFGVVFIVTPFIFIILSDLMHCVNFIKKINANTVSPH